MSIKVKVDRPFLSRNTREIERERYVVWNGFVLVCCPEEQRGVFCFPRGYNIADGVTQQNHTLICHQRSRVSRWPCIAFASGARAAHSCFVAAEG